MKNDMIKIESIGHEKVEKQKSLFRHLDSDCLMSTTSVYSIIRRTAAYLFFEEYFHSSGSGLLSKLHVQLCVESAGLIKSCRFRVYRQADRQLVAVSNTQIANSSVEVDFNELMLKLNQLVTDRILKSE